MSSGFIRSGPSSGGAACEGYIAAMVVVMTRWMNVRALVLIVAPVKESKQPMLTIPLIVVMVMRSGTACSGSVTMRHRARETVSASRVPSSIIRSGSSPDGAACEGCIPAMMVVMMIPIRWMSVRALMLIIVFMKETQQARMPFLFVLVSIVNSVVPRRSWRRNWSGCRVLTIVLILMKKT